MATRSAGHIGIDIDAMIAKFDTNMDRVNKRLDRVEKSSRKAAAASKKAADAAEKSWKAAGKAIAVVGGALLAVGAAVASRRVATALDAAANKVVDLGKKAKTLDIPVEQLSELRFAAQESNIEFENLTLMLATASRNFGEFKRTGGGPAAQAVAELNLELFDAQGNMRSVVDLLPDLSRKLSGLDRDVQLSAAGKIFGEEQGVRFVQLLQDSENFLDNLEVQRERAARLGVVFTDEQVQRLTAYTDAVNRIGEAWFGVKVRVIDAIAPELEEFLNLGASVMAAAPDIVKSVVAAFRSEDPEVQRQAALLGDSILEIFEQNGRAAGLVFIAGVYDVLGVGAQGVTPVAKRIGLGIIAGVLEGVADGIKGANIARHAFQGPAAELLDRMFLSDLTNGAAIAFDVASQVSRQAGNGGASDFVDSVGNAMTDPEGKAMPFALAKAGAVLEGVYARAGSRAEDLLGIMAKIRAHSMDIVGNARRAALSAGDDGFIGPLFPGKDPSSTPWDQFFKGVNDGYDTLYENAHNFEKLGTSSILTVTDTISGDLASALASGEVSFSNFGETAVEVMEKASESVLQLVLRFYLAQAVLGGLNYFGVGPQASAAATPSFSTFTGPMPQRHGGAWLDGMPLTKYGQGGVVNRATLFPMRRGAGLMGEAGPEAILPLTRIGGDLGVRATGGGVVVQVIDQRQGGQPADVQESSGADGKRMIRVIIRDEVRKAIGDGAMDRAMGATYGVRRRGTPR